MEWIWDMTERIGSGSVLAKDHLNIIADLPEDIRLSYITTALQLLANNPEDLTKLYNNTHTSNLITAQEKQWLEYYYAYTQSNFEQALQQLSNIEAGNEEEEYYIELSQMQLNYVLNNINWHTLTEVQVNRLKMIANQSTDYANMARDLLQ